MSWGIEEGDAVFFAALGHLNLVCTDVLGNPTGFAGRHPGLADGVQQAGLAVVDVTHHRDHRRTPNQVGQIAGLDHFHGFLGRRFDVVFKHRNAEFVRNGLDRR